MRNNSKIISLIAVAFYAAASNQTISHAQEQTYRTPKWLQASVANRQAQMTDRLIVKFKGNTAAGVVNAKALAASAGTTLDHLRSLGNRVEVMNLPAAVSNDEARKIAAQLQADPNVEYAEPDYKMFPARTPSDPGFSPGIQFVNGTFITQWYLSDPIGGINARAAWDVAVGSASTLVAIVDTGTLEHADLSGRLVAGYDFIGADGDGSFDTANDGNGRDTDARDPGNWITAQEARTGNFSSCDETPSDWHGTHIAGIIAANTDNAQKTAGINWATKIMSVRALGKCGGYISDIVDGMRWSVGMPVGGVPTNPNRANIINLSLGIQSNTSPPTCTRTMQDAIADALAAGATVVVAAGNAATDSGNSIPANCAGVISVAATLKNGQFASSYSNFGASITLSAPGGLITTATDDIGQNGILSLNDGGATAPQNNNNVFPLFGTSFSGAIVSGVASLLLDVNPNLTPTQIKAILQSTARLPSNSNDRSLDCAIDANRPCQRYVVDAVAAVNAARQGLLTTLNSNSEPISLLDFDTTISGGTSAPKTIVVRNPTGSTIQIFRLVIAGPHLDDFNAGTNCANLASPNSYPFDLGPGAECLIDVTFAAKGNNVRTADVVIASDVDLPVALTGVGRISPSNGGGGGGGGGSSGGGGGCTVDAQSEFDPILVLLLALSLLILMRRRNVRQ